MEINKETQFLTTNLRVAMYLKWIGFWMQTTTSTNGRELFVFDKSDELYEAFCFYKDIRNKLYTQK